MAASKQMLSLLVSALLLRMATMLKISAFNIKTFGDSKMSNQTIADIIVSVSPGGRRAVLAALWSLRCSWLGTVGHQLSTRASSHSLYLTPSMSPHPYSFLDSIPLGRTSYKEQYVFIYRLDMVSVLESYYYNDSCCSCETDAFSRDPFIVKFSSPTTQVEEFVMVPLHAEPSRAAEEIDALYDVYTDVVNKWATNNIFLLGDFNADCSYVTSAQWPSIRLRSLDACEWLIPDSADTTVSDTDCAYDRWVLWQGRVLPGSATVNNFQKTFHLQSKDALAVSDHFPVEVTLKSR
uniref:Deoxyribonuclease n=1 Tax=Amazona collaria TaxID=241587 RepID=A0A8B9FEX9_9PSIT